jgi:HD superfamily phosphohydrolase
VAVTWEINDPVWGSITFDPSIEEAVKKVINSELFQRLRYTSQLGLAQLVYPSATHTRFSHSVGAAFLADQLSSRVKLGRTERCAFVLSALLHDFGHPPFSHCFLRGIESRINLLQTSGSLPLVKKVSSDKDWGKQIEDSLEKLYDLIEEDIQDVVKEILYGNHRLSPLLNSDIDLDRMDYLCRDAHFCGLPYAADTRFLLNNIVLTADGVLFKKSTVTACEGLLFARLQMTKVVYQHPLVKAYETCLENLLKIVLSTDGALIDNTPAFFNECTKEKPDDNKLCIAFLQLSESDMWNYIEGLAKQERNRKAREYAQEIVKRSISHPSDQEPKVTFYKGGTFIQGVGTSNLRDVSGIVRFLEAEDKQKEQAKEAARRQG